MNARRQRHRSSAGVSYLELSLAMFILAICILPATQALPSLLAGQRDLETKYQLSLIAQQKLEAAALDLRRDFSETADEGDLGAEGHPDWRYKLVVIIPDGGPLATICVTVFADEDGDHALDADEPQVRFDSAVADCNWGA